MNVETKKKEESLSLPTFWRSSCRNLFIFCSVSIVEIGFWSNRTRARKHPNMYSFEWAYVKSIRNMCHFFTIINFVNIHVVRMFGQLIHWNCQRALFYVSSIDMLYSLSFVIRWSIWKWGGQTSITQLGYIERKKKPKLNYHQAM